MEALTRQVRRARRRLTLQQFLQALTWFWFGTLMAAAVAVVVDKYFPLGVQLWVWFAGALGLGGLLALAYTFWKRRGVLDAAIELDRRFGLKERVSSSLSLEPAELDTAAGQALVADALKRVERIHVAEQFGVSLGRWSWLPLLPAAAAFLLAVFLPEMTQQQAKATQDPVVESKQIKKSKEVLNKKLAERRKEAREKGLKDADHLFDKLEKDLRSSNKADKQDKKQALVKLNDLAKDVAKRQQELAATDKIKQQLNQLKSDSHGPADKLGEALKQGDLKNAMKEIDKLKDQLATGKLDEKAKQELGKQLDQMQKAMNKLAEAHKQAQQDLQQQIKQKQAQGKTAEAAELQKKLDKLAQQNAQMQNLQKMADKLGQAADAMKQGDKDKAMAGLESMKADLDQLQEQLDEMAMLDEIMDELDQAKDSMNCKKCGGAGCKFCQGDRPGDGLGKGRGIGYRPEEKTDKRWFDSKVKQKSKGGTGVITGMVEGPNIKGDVAQDIKVQLETAKSESADPLTGQRLPREYREHARKYFDSLREGQ